MRTHAMRLAAALVLGVALHASGRAAAQDVLEFKPVPPESVDRLEQPRKHRGLPGPAATPDAPEAPATPIPPKPPEVVIGKSGNIMRIGSDVHVERDQVVTGDLLAVGGDVTVDGHVEGDVVAMGGDIHLSATARVDGDVACIGGELSEDPGASVTGQRVTAAGARGMRGIRGDRLRRHVEGRAMRTAGHIVSSMVWMFIMLLVAWGFSNLSPGRTGAALATLQREPAVSLGVGALVWALFVPSVVALALVVAVLCITIIGIPLAIAALFGYFVFLAVLTVWGYAIAAAALGERVASRLEARAGAAGGVMSVPGPGVSAMAGASGGPAAISLSRKAVLGVVVLGGTGLVGELLQSLGFVPPLHGIGVFLSVVSTVGSAIAATIGGGAWLRTEIVSGTFRRWVGARRGSVPPSPEPSWTPPAPQPPPPPPAAPPSNPADFAPPPAPGGPGVAAPEPEPPPTPST